MGTEVIKEYYQDMRVAESYDRDRFADIGGRTFDRLEKRAIRKMVRRVVGEWNDPKVLDVPCGTGRITETLLEMGLTVTGMDISREMIDVAKIKCERFEKRVSFLQKDLEAADLPESSFDLVCCIRMLHHLDTQTRRRILAALSRMSRRYVLINVSYSSPFYRVRRRIKRLLGQGISRESSTWKDIQEEAEAAGLGIERVGFICRFMSENMVVLLRKKT